LDDFNYPHLIHQVILLETTEKKISSSQAHQRVKTSPFYKGRAERATKRLSLFIQALNNKNWEKLYHIAWDEFQDMHRLFETAIPAFTYQNQTSLVLLEKLRAYWEAHGDGPLITMDAGPNIHLLYRPDQQDLQQKIQHQLLSGYSYVLST
jgi:diphosphomevalonate decarboxylase